MARDRATFATGAHDRAATCLAVAGDCQRYLLRHALRLRVAAITNKPSAVGTVYRWFAIWRDACLFEKINHVLVMADRERIGRQASPATIPDKHQIELVAKSPNDMGKQ